VLARSNPDYEIITQGSSAFDDIQVTYVE